jgi:putative transposase
MWYYQSKRDDGEVIDKLNELAEQLPTRGFDEYYNRLRKEGLKWNRKRVLRVYRSMGLSIRRKRKKRLPCRTKQPLNVPSGLNHTWSMDFMSDALSYGRRIRILNVIDDYNREALAIEAAHSFPGERVVRILKELVFLRGKPKQIRVDNGPEFLSKIFVNWCQLYGIEIVYIQPGKPAQNAYIERFNRLFREDVLDAYIFDNIDQVRELSDQWMNDYNYNHPHGSLNKKSPIEFAKTFQLRASSSMNNAKKENKKNVYIRPV